MWTKTHYIFGHVFKPPYNFHIIIKRYVSSSNINIRVLSLFFGYNLFMFLYSSKILWSWLNVDYYAHDNLGSTSWAIIWTFLSNSFNYLNDFVNIKLSQINIHLNMLTPITFILYSIKTLFKPCEVIILSHKFQN